ncbi:MAG: hypothetical protein ACXADB_00445 [Candidatus Hermodarchaeia archaeon]|jgi:hypothetical protein
MLRKDNEEGRTYRIGKEALHEDDLKIPIMYNGETFVLKYPNPAVKATIESEIARRLGGFPRSSFSTEHLAEVEAYVTIDVLYDPKECPKWFEGPWATYDDELIRTLIEGYYQFRERFRTRLRSRGFAEGSKGDSP